MRRTIIGLTLAGALAVAGCSDSDAGGESAGSGSSETFCADFEELNDRFTEDPAAAGDIDQVVESLESLTPPETIAADFDTVVDAARRLSELDPEDPAAAAEAQQLNDDAAAAQGRVSDYLQTECNLDTGTSGAESGDAPTTAPAG